MIINYKYAKMITFKNKTNNISFYKKKTQTKKFMKATNQLNFKHGISFFMIILNKIHGKFRFRNKSDYHLLINDINLFIYF